MDCPSRRILSARIVGEQAVEVVQIVTTGMWAGMPVEQLADVEFAYRPSHPSWCSRLAGASVNWASWPSRPAGAYPNERLG